MGDQDHGQVPVQVSSQCSWSYFKYAKYFFPTLENNSTKTRKYFITAEDLGKLIHALTSSSILCDFLNETYNVP